VLPGYEILEEAGRGGMGVVYKARQLALKRIVALKVILGGGHASAVDRGRFKAEAEAVARLQHPGIVQIHEIGEYNGLPYFVLEFCEGGTLAARLAGTPLPPVEAARLVEQLARAVQAAHQAQVIHRDLKPTNVLLTADGTPKVTDFGLAKNLDEAGQTHSGAVVGTASYMAPEQAAGRSKDVGPATDVWALGAILYEVLTGRPPFKAVTTFDTIAQVLDTDPVSPRQLQPTVPRDLETICLKCLRKERHRRYTTALDLAEDLGRFQRQEPVTARPVGWAERTARWVRRRPAVAALLGTLAAVAVTAFTVVTWQLGETKAALTRAEQEQRQRALAQVNALRDAAPGAVPGILADLERSRAEVLPRLRELWVAGGDEAKRMRLALALAPVEPETVRAPLLAWMLKADDPAEVLLVREALLPHKAELTERLWTLTEDTKSPEGRRLRALTALAVFDPKSERWGKVGETAAGLLLAANPFYQGQWAGALRPVRQTLLGPLVAVCRDPKLPESRQTAAIVLADYAADQPDLLAEVLLAADPKQFAVLQPALAMHRAKAVERLRRELAVETAKDASLVQRELLAKRQAMAAVALLHLGDDEPVWPLLRHTPEPEARSQLVWRTKLYGVDPVKLVRRLELEKDPSARRALIVALGDYTGEQLPAAERESLTQKLLTWYRDDPDAGIHGAIDWLLRHRQEGPTARPLAWGQAKALQQLDDELKRRDPDGKRGWYVNQQGQTLVLVPGPVEFRMGSPPDEPGHFETERLHRRRIGRNYAIASKPVTVTQFQRFLKDRPDVSWPPIQVYAPEGDCPILGVSWYRAAQYCNWLSEQEGIPEDQWCYPKDADIKEGMKPYPDYLQRKGYRLATEAEWEYACRAETTSSRSYGSSVELLGRHAWYIHNAQDRSWPVGQKRPNDLGLFDMHGNVWTWVQDRAFDYPQGVGAIEDKEDIRNIVDRTSRVLRGGSFTNRTLVVRSAQRDHIRPDDRSYSVGLRVARTYD